MKIGFFDSGLGGLIILKAVSASLPEYDYEFYGDTAHLPYGDRSEAEIYELTKAGVLHLFARDCALVIIACNTASSQTLRKLQDTILTGEYQARRILGVIIPTVETVVESGEKKVMLFATKRTVESKKYERELSKLDDKLLLKSKALPGLVPLIESGELDQAWSLLKLEIESVVKQGVSDIILGCTHYSLLKEKVREVEGVGEVYSQDEIIPKKLANYLERHSEITSQLSSAGKRNIVLTEHKPNYDGLISEFLGGVHIPEEN